MRLQDRARVPGYIAGGGRQTWEQDLDALAEAKGTPIIPGIDHVGGTPPTCVPLLLVLLLLLD